MSDLLVRHLTQLKETSKATNIFLPTVTMTFTMTTGSDGNKQRDTATVKRLKQQE